MSSRIRIPIKVLEQEKRDILHFTLDDVARENDAKVHTQDLFSAYKVWRKRMKFKPTALSCDGFGRMFPDIGVNKIVTISGETFQGYTGIKVKEYN